MTIAWRKPCCYLFKMGFPGRAVFVMVSLLLPAAMLSACDTSLGDERKPLSVTSNSRTAPQTPVDAVATATIVEEQRDAGEAEADGQSEAAATQYEVMCRNYCQDLEDTGFYFCVSRGQDQTSCAQMVSGRASQCYELRCVPKLVQPSLCLTQCDGLAASYGAVCADAGGDASAPPFCPSSPPEHDRICRAGCSSPSSPPD